MMPASACTLTLLIASAAACSAFNPSHASHRRTSQPILSILYSDVTLEDHEHTTLADDDYPSEDTTEPPLSKNQLKKRRRRENYLRCKAQSREMRRLKAHNDGRDLDAERQQQLQNEKEGKWRKIREDRWKQSMQKADIENSFRVCFDCSFDDQMTWKETNSLSKQLSVAYAVNRKSSMPVYIDVCWSKRGGQTRGHLEKVQGFPERWAGRNFRCFEGGLEEVYSRTDDNESCEKEWKEEPGSSNNKSETTNDHVRSESNESTKSEEQPSYPKLPPNHQFVYLTGDSPNTLTTLDDNTTYIIGGIVDRNRLKRVAIQRAESINTQTTSLTINTARLPLDEHIDFKDSTRILTCNHVFEILQKYRENGYKDWRSAIITVLPCRKDLEEKNEGIESVKTEEKETSADAVNSNDNST